MKFIITIVLCIIVGTAIGQRKDKTDSSFYTIHRIFSAYLSSPESANSQAKEDSMTKALTALQYKGAKVDIYYLLNVWLYYDPIGFPTRELINPIFFANRSRTIEQIDKRIEYKATKENIDTKPLSDLFILKDALLKSQ